MVPIYSLASFLPLVMGQNAFVIGSLKDCYEAFLIYTFLAYIFELLGEESDIVGRIQACDCSTLSKTKGTRTGAKCLAASVHQKIMNTASCCVCFGTV